ncbi:MAG: hypothetical protein LBL94_01045 [Prevotellaceae bacterium]|jgi:hypothetical protein|nr:hypothetical protein [Prevotellaceae bacterium]
MGLETIHANYIAPLIVGVILILIKIYTNHIRTKNKLKKSFWIKLYILTTLILLVIFGFLAWNFYGNSNNPIDISPIPADLTDTVTTAQSDSNSIIKPPIKIITTTKTGSVGKEIKTDSFIEPPKIAIKEITETGAGFDYHKNKAIENAIDSASKKLIRRGFSPEEVKYREVINKKIDTLSNGIEATVTIKINIKSN